MSTLTRRLPLVVFAVVFSLEFIGSYFARIEYRRNPSGRTEGVVLKQDLSDHAKLTAHYSVNGVSYEHIETANLSKPGDKIDVYYLLSDPAHATFANPEWIWHQVAVETFLGVGLWCALIYVGLRLRDAFRGNEPKKKTKPNQPPEPMPLKRHGSS